MSYHVEQSLNVTWIDGSRHMVLCCDHNQSRRWDMCRDCCAWNVQTSQWCALIEPRWCSNTCPFAPWLRSFVCNVVFFVFFFKSLHDIDSQLKACSYPQQQHRLKSAFWSRVRDRTSQAPSRGLSWSFISSRVAVSCAGKRSYLIILIIHFFVWTTDLKLKIFKSLWIVSYFYTLRLKPNAFLDHCIFDAITMRMGDCNQGKAMANKQRHFSSQSRFIILLGKLPWGKLLDCVCYIILSCNWVRCPLRSRG